MAYSNLPSPTTAGGKIQFTVPGTEAGTVSVRLKAANNTPAGQAGMAAVPSKTVPQLDAPTGVQATATSSSALSVTASNVAHASSYRLYTAATQTGTYAQLGGVISSPPYNHTGLNAAQTQWYKWQAVGDGITYSDSALSAAFSGTTLAVTTAPIVGYNSTTRKLTASHSLGGTILFSYQGSAYLEYLGEIAVDNAAHVPGDWKFKRQATTTYEESPVSNSPAIAAFLARPGYDEGIARLNLTVSDFAGITKETKQAITAEIVNANLSNYSTAQLLPPTASDIKGAGNSTWLEIKKPYNLTFKNVVNILGLSSKKFRLLAEYGQPGVPHTEQSLCRSSMAGYLTELMGVTAPRMRPVVVYVRASTTSPYEFQGYYTLSEKADTRVLDVYGNNTVVGQHVNNDQEGTSVEDIKTRANYFQSTLFNTTGGVVLENPEFGKATEVQFLDFQNRVLAAEAAMTKDNWDTLIDAPNVFKNYLHNEFVKSPDAGYQSDYFYFLNNKYVAGPPWDADHGFPKPDYSNNNPYDDNPSLPLMIFRPVYAALLSVPNFTYKLKQAYTALAPLFPKVLTFFNNRTQLLEDTGVALLERNKWYGGDINDYLNSHADIREYLPARVAFLETYYGANQLAYDGPIGEGVYGSHVPPVLFRNVEANPEYEDASSFSGPAILMTDPNFPLTLHFRLEAPGYLDIYSNTDPAFGDSSLEIPGFAPQIITQTSLASDENGGHTVSHVIGTSPLLQPGDYAVLYRHVAGTGGQNLSSYDKFGLRYA